MPDVRGPFPVTPADIPPLNVLFSDAFSDRYRRDGMAGVRVPPLHHDIWRFSIADASGGAMLWRDGDGELVAFNMAHQSGVEGWMGPLAVRADAQGHGVGSDVVRAGIAWLAARGATVIGLETMPRTVDNIGFYSQLGFVPGPLTVTFALDATNDGMAECLGARAAPERERLIAEATALTQRVLPGYDYAREMRLTAQMALGDTVLLVQGGSLRGFAICHAAPLVEGREPDEVRVLKVVLDDESLAPDMLRRIAVFAFASGNQRAAIRIHAGYRGVYRAALAAGARVRWTDLRMTLDGFGERAPARGVVLSNWEI